MGAVLILIDPFSALVVTAVLCGAYCIIFVTVRPALSRMGKERLEANRTRFEIATEALGGIKTLKILDRENQYVERFRKPSHLLARNLALSNVIGMAPKFAVETIGFGGILVLALTLMVRSGGSSGAGSSLVIPILALYALAGYRMLPAVQTIYLSVTQLKFAQPSVSAMRRELTLCGCREGLAQLHAHPLPFARTLALDKVSYHYPGSNAAGLKDVSFTLPRGSSLGIVGSTGSGKTTFIDVLLGLLEPQSGNVLVDGIPIGPANRPEWRMTSHRKSSSLTARLPRTLPLV